MDAFWTRLHSPSAILMAFIAAFCLAYLARIGYSAYRTTSGRVVAGTQREGLVWWLIFVVIGILAGIEWVILVFLS